ncbi:aminopeptidase [Niastella koreensis]|uniref:Peptidase M28 n=2 Tax=Niastella koreensis TaxID=354356 RepID=G8TL86_NIAKG|nr:M20/M25/M40 family metallo-hydrolase [Niastella koreensis]AEW01927.1 peptidase M28 [Niastella koreensis GR20-10]OQP48629.1 aminopeptidase [Niastella koreensis]
MVKRCSYFILLLLIKQTAFSQAINKIINAKEVERIEKTLSADDMRGRKAFSPEIDKAADFIAAEFKKAGLEPGNGSSFLQEFAMFHNKPVAVSGTMNGKTLDEKSVAVLSAKESLSINQSSGFKQVVVTTHDVLPDVLMKIKREGGNYLLMVDTVHRMMFERIKRSSLFTPKGDIVMVLSAEEAGEYSIQFKQTVSSRPLKNVVGILPGKSKKEEYVIFSGHYDHLGVGKANAAGDSIYNGANDDAAGTTAVIMLANYFAKQKKNERTLVFVAFTAEEAGGFGSQYFSQNFNPDKVMAMFNIEMIGTESKWGTNSAFITGYEKTDMGKILEKNLEGTDFKFYPDPYPDQQLFYRSDNATLARQGVPAHTISTSKMDSEKFYHTQEDEIETLDMNNMAAIIRAIAISSTSIVAGKDTPARVAPESLRR